MLTLYHERNSAEFKEIRDNVLRQRNYNTNIYIYIYIYIYIKAKVKESRNRPGVAQRVSGSLDSQISMTFGI